MVLPFVAFLKTLFTGVTLGCVNGDPEVELSRHIYTGSKASWETIPAGVPQYAEGADV